MANPTVVTTALGSWTAVATNVTNITLHRQQTGGRKYAYTYRMTGDPAPTDLSDAQPFDEPISFGPAAAIDIYVYSMVQAGSVRVDEGVLIEYLIDG